MVDIIARALAIQAMNSESGGMTPEQKMALQSLSLYLKTFFDSTLYDTVDQTNIGRIAADNAAICLDDFINSYTGGDFHFVGEVQPDGSILYRKRDDN